MSYEGKLSGTYAHSVAGLALQTAKVEGTYEVTTDEVTGACAYSDDFETSTGQHLHHTGFLSGEGVLQEGHLIYLDLGWMVSGTAKRR